MKIELSALAALLAIAASGPAIAQERWVYVHNQGDLAIYTVQISHIGTPFTGPDLLGPTTIIQSGSYALVEPWNPQGYCRFDVVIGYENGQDVTLWDLNLCELADIYVSESGATQVSY